MEKPRITVFLTKKYKFRMRFVVDGITGEVTIGGKEWNSGKGRQFEAEAKLKCKKLADFLSSQFQQTFDN